MSLYALRQMKRRGASKDEMDYAGDLCYMEMRERRWEEEQDRIMTEAAEKEKENEKEK